MMTPSTMTKGSHDKPPSNTALAVSVIAALVLIALLLVSPAASATVSEQANPVLASNAKCLKCHSRHLKKTLEDGEKLSLHIDQDALAKSAHSGIPCTGCHKSIAGKRHPAKEAISSARSFSKEMNQICARCHAGKFSQYEGSIHASLVAEGNVAAPMCTDCHSAHAVQTMAAYEPATGLPCKKCHVAIYKAYAQSVHGKARAEGNVIRAGHIKAPVCIDCHHAHKINAVASGDQLKATCLSCHKNATLAHEKWLPNAELHMSVVSCPACHSPRAKRTIDLELYDKVARVPVGQDGNYDGMGKRMASIEKSPEGLDAVELWKLVRESSREGKAVDVTLRGRMKVETGAQAHQIAPKGQALRNCDSCHREGSAAFQNVTVSIANPDGRKKYYPASNKILSSVASVGSINDFYAMGGTRIKLLDILLVLALIGGLAIPVGHMTIGRLLKKKR